jgi:predicted SnoaL-like aldol condensation-catalyzing enzyme
MQSRDALEANKAIVRKFCDLALNQAKAEEAVSMYVGDTYRQHNPHVEDGPEAFIVYVKVVSKRNPHRHREIKRMIAEGDMVVVHSHVKLDSGDRGRAVVDIFRLEEGKIVEHWDVAQPVPEESANPNTMF